MDDYEQLYTQLEEKFGLSLIPVVRRCSITNAVNTNSYTIRYPDGGLRDQVESCSATVPLIGDSVRVELINGRPIITDVIGRGLISEMDGTDGNAVTGSATYISSGSTGDTIDVEMVTGQSVWVQVAAGKCAHTLGAGHGALMSFKVTGVETYGPNDKDGFEVDNLDWVEAQRLTKFTATANGTHTFTLQYRAINGGNASFWFRRLNIWE